MCYNYYPQLNLAIPWLLVTQELRISGILIFWTLFARTWRFSIWLTTTDSQRLAALIFIDSSFLGAGASAAVGTETDVGATRRCQGFLWPTFLLTTKRPTFMISSDAFSCYLERNPSEGIHKDRSQIGAHIGESKVSGMLVSPAPFILSLVVSLSQSELNLRIPSYHATSHREPWAYLLVKTSFGFGCFLQRKYQRQQKILSNM